jgi:hypothetical protein
MRKDLSTKETSTDPCALEENIENILHLDREK